MDENFHRAVFFGGHDTEFSKDKPSVSLAFKLKT